MPLLRAESGLWLEEPALSLDGRWLVYGRSEGGASVWMLTLWTRRAAVTLVASVRLASS